MIRVSVGVSILLLLNMLGVATPANADASESCLRDPSQYICGIATGSQIGIGGISEDLQPGGPSVRAVAITPEVAFARAPSRCPGMQDKVESLGFGSLPLGCPYMDGEDQVAWKIKKDGGQEGVSIADAVAQVSREFRSWRLAPSPLSVQPDGGQVLVNVPTIVYTQAEPQTYQTHLLGLDVMVEASPQRFVYDFGDGSDPLVTADAGAPYPDYTTHHVYTLEGEVVISLRTEWVGRMRIEGFSDWIAIDGVATTTSASDPIWVDALEVHLIPNQDQ